MSVAAATLRAAVPRPDEHVTEPIGDRLKRLRLARGLSQRELSAPGVSYAYISRIEAGARTPSVKALRMLAAKLEVSVDYLETGRDIRDADDRELRLSDLELEVRFADDTVEAERKLQVLCEEAKRVGDPLTASGASIALGFAAARRGSHLDAVELLEAGLNLSRVAPHVRPDVYATLGECYAALGAADRAVRIFEQSIADVSEHAPSDAGLRVRFATLLSYALSDDGDHERAASVVRDALRRAKDDTDPNNRIRLYWSMARSAGLDGRYTEALRSIRKAIALLEVTDDTARLARGYALAAGIDADEGNLDEAREGVERARALLGSRPEPRDEGMLRIVEAQCAVLEGEGEDASSLARDALAILGDFHGGEQGAAVWVLAKGLALEHDEVGANDTFKRATDLLVVHGRRHDAARCAAEWGTFLREHGRDAEAERVLQRATELELPLEAEAAHAS